MTDRCRKCFRAASEPADDCGVAECPRKASEELLRDIEERAARRAQGVAAREAETRARQLSAAARDAAVFEAKLSGPPAADAED